MAIRCIYACVALLFCSQPVFDQSVDSATEKLLACVKDDGAALPVRTGALGRLWARTEPATALRLTGILGFWLDEIERIESECAAAGDNASGGNEAGGVTVGTAPVGGTAGALAAICIARIELLRGFVNAAAAQPVQGAAGLAVLSLCERIGTQSFCDVDSAVAACVAVARCDAPLSRRREAIVRLLADSPARGCVQVPPAVVGIFDESALEPLRSIVSQDVVERAPGLAAMAVLAHHGDSSVASDLRQWQVTESAGRAGLVRAAAKWYLWQIEAQSSSAQLLTLLADSGYRDGRTRIWLMNRAARCGSSAGSIRSTIIAHALTLNVTSDQRGAIALSELKHAAIEAAILNESDLPSIPGRAPRPRRWASDVPAFESAEEGPPDPRLAELIEWTAALDFDTLTAAQLESLVRGRMCALGLLPANGCNASG